MQASARFRSAHSRLWRLKIRTSASFESAGSIGALADARASDAVHRVTSARDERAGSTRVVKCAMSVAAGGTGENQLSFISGQRVRAYALNAHEGVRAPSNSVRVHPRGFATSQLVSAPHFSS